MSITHKPTKRDLVEPTAINADPSELEISLLEEKLQIDRRRQKLGEVVIRKEVETHVIEIPLRKEKLIVERQGVSTEKIAEVVVAEDRVNGFGFDELKKSDRLHITKSHYLSVAQAQDLLHDLGRSAYKGRTKIRIEVVTDSSEHQIKHQNMCDRFVQK